jgi:hypothetical protein
MATPSTYSHFENAVPCGDDGLAVGPMGSEVTVADSAGALYQSGSAMATVPTYPIGHTTTASQLVAFGTATLDDKKTVATGLTAVTASVVTRRLDDGSATPTASSLDPVIFNSVPSAGNIVIRGYGVACNGTGNPTYNAGSAVVATVDWIAWGT